MATDKTKLYLSLLTSSQLNQLCRLELGKHQSQLTRLDQERLGIMVRNFVSQYIPN